MTRQEYKKLFLVSLFCLLGAITVSLLNSRLIKVKCMICKEDVDSVSLVEYYFGSWRSIPILHPICNSYIIDFLAPNSDMTAGEWLEIRGWEPRHNEAKLTREELHKKLLEENKGRGWDN